MLVYISLRGQPSDLAPGSKGVVSGGSVLTGRKAMAAELEVVVDRSVIDPALIVLNERQATPPRLA